MIFRRIVRDGQAAGVPPHGRTLISRGVAFDGRDLEGRPLGRHEARGTQEQGDDKGRVAPYYAQKRKG
jgi:hypothetical protein